MRFPPFQAVLTACLLCAPLTVFAQARPFTLDDVLKREAIGSFSIAPNESYVVIERQGPLDSAPSYEYGYYNSYLRTELLVVDSARLAMAHRLLPEAEGDGHLIGEWSPSGERLLVYRLRDRTWSAGIVVLATGEVRWIPDLTPELPIYGRVAQWLSDNELVMISRRDGDLPVHLRREWETTERLPQLWAQTLSGGPPGRIAIGSGRWRDATPQTEPGRLVRIDAVSGSVTSLAEGVFEDLEVSSNRAFAALTTRGALPPAMKADEPIVQADIHRPRGLAIVNIQTGELWEPCGDCEPSPALLTWAPDAEELLVWLHDPDQPWRQGGLVRLDASQRRLRPVSLQGLEPAIRESGERHAIILADWLAGDPILFARTTSDRSDWYRLTDQAAVPLTRALAQADYRLAAIDGDDLLLAADSAVWRIDTEGQAIRLSPEGIATTVVNDARIDHLALRLHYNNTRRRGWTSGLTEDGRLFRFGREVSAEPIRLGEGYDLRPMAVSENIAITSRTSPQGIRSLDVVTPSGVQEAIVQVNTAYDERMFAQRVEIHHTGPDGRPLKSWLYLPAVPPQSPPPLVVKIYPGSVRDEPDSWEEPGGAVALANAQGLANAGFAVLLPSLPVDPNSQEPMAGLADAILGVVDAAATTGTFDPDRIALFGHSFGAYAAVAVATQTSRFRAVIAANGLYELAQGWGVFQPGPRISPQDGLSVTHSAGAVETGQVGVGGPPWIDPERYRRNSPFYVADKITTPVLLIAGDFDPVPMTASEALFSTLYRQGKDAKLITYFGEGHIFFSPGAIQDANAEILAWLRQTLSLNEEAVRPGLGSPSTRPTLDDGADHDVAVFASPDELVAIQGRFDPSPVEQTLGDEQPVEQVRLQ
jgi:dipeptidyl aminopeptidase/acylaminoacyl peptidase